MSPFLRLLLITNVVKCKRPRNKMRKLKGAIHIRSHLTEPTEFGGLGEKRDQAHDLCPPRRQATAKCV